MYILYRLGSKPNKISFSKRKWEKIPQSRKANTMITLKSLLMAVTVSISFSLFAPSVEAVELLPLEERQKLIHERAKKQAEARRQRIEARRNAVYTPRYYYYQYQYVYPHYHHYHYQPYIYYNHYRPTVYFWYRY